MALAALQDNFNSSSGIEEDQNFALASDAANDADYLARDTSAANAEYYDNFMNNLEDIQSHDIDYVSLHLGDYGKEEAFYQIKEIADTTSGELGKAATLEESVDQAQERFQGSLSQNLSEDGQARQEALELSVPDDFIDRPDMAETEAAISAVYFELMESGVPESDLVHAMAAGGPDDHHATIEVFHDLAQENGLPMLGGYLEGVDHALIEQQQEMGLRDLPTPVGTTPEPEAEPALAVAPDAYSAPRAPGMV